MCNEWVWIRARVCSRGGQWHMVLRVFPLMAAKRRWRRLEAVCASSGTCAAIASAANCGRLLDLFDLHSTMYQMLSKKQFQSATYRYCLHCIQVHPRTINHSMYPYKDGNCMLWFENFVLLQEIVRILVMWIKTCQVFQHEKRTYVKSFFILYSIVSFRLSHYTGNADVVCIELASHEH